MGCKNSRDSREDVNPFDVKAHRSMSRRNNTPRARSSSSRRQSPASGEAARDASTASADEVVERRYDVVDVPLVYSRFASLPSGAVKRSVFTVYDGDTITLRGRDNAKVRLLAMDTPEVQDHEPYALEARDFVAKLILKKDVFLVFEGPEKDRYDRYLAHVYVKDKSVEPFRFINVNIAAIEAGFATYYHPFQTEPLALDAVFLQAQGSARSKKLHFWKDVCEDYVVYRTAHGRAFHRKNCRSIEHVPLSSMEMKEALDQGFYPCRDCHPNWASKGKHITDHAVKPAAAPHTQTNGPSYAAVVSKPVSTERIAEDDVPEAIGSSEPTDVAEPEQIIIVPGPQQAQTAASTEDDHCEDDNKTIATAKTEGEGAP